MESLTWVNSDIKGRAIPAVLVGFWQPCVSHRPLTRFVLTALASQPSPFQWQAWSRVATTTNPPFRSAVPREIRTIDVFGADNSRDFPVHSARLNLFIYSCNNPPVLLTTLGIFFRCPSGHRRKSSRDPVLNVVSRLFGSARAQPSARTLEVVEAAVPGCFSAAGQARTT